MMDHFAPPNENNTARYKKFLHEVTGVKDNRKINAFTDNEFEKLWQGVEQIEGYKEGSIVQMYKITHARQEKSGCICEYLKFSPDNKVLFFLTSAWVTSGALHVININGSKPRYLQPANSFDVIKHGKYKGKLVIQQHQYASGGGSYEGCWLYTSEGKKVRRLSENRCDNI